MANRLLFVTLVPLILAIAIESRNVVKRQAYGRRCESDPKALFTDPDNCGCYFHCDHGQAIQKCCQSRLEFDENRQRCDWPQSSRWDCKRIDSDTKQSIKYECSSNAVGSQTEPYVVANPDICNAFYMCTPEGFVASDFCRFCGFGQYFHMGIRECLLFNTVEQDFFCGERVYVPFENITASQLSRECSSQIWAPYPHLGQF